VERLSAYKPLNASGLTANSGIRHEAGAGVFVAEAVATTIKGGNCISLSRFYEDISIVLG